MPILMPLRGWSELYYAERWDVRVDLAVFWSSTQKKSQVKAYSSHLENTAVNPVNAGHLSWGVAMLRNWWKTSMAKGLTPALAATEHCGQPTCPFPQSWVTNGFGNSCHQLRLGFKCAVDSWEDTFVQVLQVLCFTVTCYCSFSSKHLTSFKRFFFKSVFVIHS